MEDCDISKKKFRLHDKLYHWVEFSKNVRNKDIFSTHRGEAVCALQHLRQNKSKQNSDF